MRKLKVFLIRSLVKLMSALPLGAIHGVARFLGAMIYKSNANAVKVTRKNLSLSFPDLDSAALEKLTRESVIETLKCMGEMCRVWLACETKVLATIVKVSNEHLLKEAKAAGKGVVIIAPHLGNWELLNLYVSKNYPLNVLYQRPNIIELDGFIRDVRARSGAQTHATDRAGILAIFQALRKTEVTGILPDQQPRPEAGIFAPFFGQPTLTMTLVSKLVQKTGAAVVCAYAKRLPAKAGFEIVFLPADPNIQSADVQESVAALNRSVESCVRDAPAQYQWEYKRFKRNPEGRTQHYKFK